MILVEPAATKVCPDCKRELPIRHFARNRRQPDGLSYCCRSCASTGLLASGGGRYGSPRTRKPGQSAVPEGSKWCPECDEIKLVGEFPKNRSSKSGLGTYCKPCHNRICRENKEKHGGARNYHLRRRYGITVEHFDRMFAEQGGLCAICREAPAEHVDHDHATGRVRALLCFNCNGALGQFRDRPDLMLAAYAYLQGADGRDLIHEHGFTVSLSLVPPLENDLEETA